MTLLSDIAFYRTYAALKPDGTKECWDEVCDRYQAILVKKYPGPHEAAVIEICVSFIRRKLVVPSMRMFQFAGAPVEKENLRGYNCAFVAITSVKDLQDILYLSSCGVGVGYSVQRRHVEQLPVVPEWYPDVYPIKDSRESWADTVGVLMNNPGVRFDYSAIRPAGAALSTGGAASGPEPLRECHEHIRGVLLGAVGRKLRPLEVHSIATSIGHAIVSGGVRRSAMISLFDRDDQEMLTSKSGEWWVKNPHFARANNSAVLPRDEVTRAEFDSVLDACFASGAGEPGFVFTNDADWGVNPCAEIALRSRQLCNLTEVVASNCANEAEFGRAVIIATILGTYQAGFTDFTYVHPDWKKNCEAEALLGVSITGQAQNWSLLSDGPALRRIAGRMKDINHAVAARIGINPAARIGTTKPSGTTSSVLNCSAGVHAVHAPFYLRRIRVNKLDPVATYLQANMPAQFIENNPYEPNDVIVGIPTFMPGISRGEESALDLLKRVKHIQKYWIRPSHVSGANSHNVSVTVSYKPKECKGLKGWVWRNRAFFNCISFLPYSDTCYDYAPYTEIPSHTYADLVSAMPALDLSTVKFGLDTREDTSGCEGNLCALPGVA